MGFVNYGDLKRFPSFSSLFIIIFFEEFFVVICNIVLKQSLAIDMKILTYVCLITFLTSIQTI